MNVNFTHKKIGYVYFSSLLILFFTSNLFAQESKIEDTPVTESFFGFNMNMVLEKLADKYEFQLDYEKELFSSKPLQGLTFRGIR